MDKEKVYHITKKIEFGGHDGKSSFMFLTVDVLHSGSIILKLAIANESINIICQDSAEADNVISLLGKAWGMIRSEVVDSAEQQVNKLWVLNSFQDPATREKAMEMFKKKSKEE